LTENQVQQSLMKMKTIKKITKQNNIMTVSIPFDEIIKAYTFAEKVAGDLLIDTQEIACQFIMNHGSNITFQTAKRGIQRNKLKNCFGGYEGNEECQKCFLSTACDLVCKGVVEEKSEFREDDEEEEDDFSDKEAPDKADIKKAFSHKLKAPPKEGEVIWRRAAKTDNLCGTVIIKGEMIKVTIFPSRFKDGKFTACFSSDTEKPDFKDGFRSEDEAKEFVKELVDSLT
jgi:hypothetical protein